MKVDEGTEKNIAERMEEFRNEALTVVSDAQAKMMSAQFNVKSPVMVTDIPS